MPYLNCRNPTAKPAPALAQVRASRSQPRSDFVETPTGADDGSTAAVADQPLMSSGLAPVHVVVLAAGRGSRLGARGGETPKWLLEVNGRTLADRQLEGIRAAGDAVASVSVVVGHAADAIEEALARRSDDVEVVRNPEFLDLNNWWSLLRALRQLPDDGPVLVMNADLLLDPLHVTAFIRAAAVADANDGLLAVDLERRLTDESMKVARAPDGTLQGIGKVAVPAPAGEYIGMLMARGRVLRATREVLESFVGRDEAANEWYEAAVGRTAATGMWHVWPMPSTHWIEIDDDDDLESAYALARAT